MMLTTTTVGFALFSLGLGFCGFRFFGAFQKIGGQRVGRRIGVLLSTWFFSNAIALGILAIGTFFFAHNTEVLYLLLVISHVPLTIGSVFGVYSVFYILFPSISPRPAIAMVSLLGGAVIVLTVMTHPQPFINASGGIDWNMSHLLGSLLSYLVLFHMGSQCIVFTHSFLQTKSREVKFVSSVMVFLGLIGAINIFMYFLSPSRASDDFGRNRIFDMTFMIMGTIFIGIFLLPPVIIKWLAKVRKNDGFTAHS